MNTASFSIRESIAFGWAMVKEKFWFLLALLAISGFFAILTDLIEQFVQDSSVLFVVKVFSIVIGLVIDAGLLYVMLRLHDGKETKISDIFSQYPITFRYFVVNAVYMVVAFVGLIVFIVPGIYVLIRYQFSKYFLIDKRLGIEESFKESARITDGRKWQLFRFALVLVAINILGLLALVVGLVVTIPLTMLATVHAYRKLSAPIKETVPTEEVEVLLGSNQGMEAN